jgi:Domain of unknown function (DUF4760)
MNEGLAIIVAAILAILGIFYTSRQQRKLLRKQHTYQVLDKLNDWGEFQENYDFAASLIKSGDPVPESHEHRIDFLLNYYEFLAAAIIAGDIDEALVRRVEESRLCRLFLKLLPYVEQNRRELASEKLWENMEFICHRWAVHQDDEFEAAMTALALRPSITDFRGRRSEVMEALRQKAAAIR